MPKPLTARAVEMLKANPAKRLEIPDGHLPGLYLVVQPSGAKTWACRYRSKATGKPVKHTIGRYPIFSLMEARQSAGEALRAVAEGRDPAAEKKARKGGDVGSLLSVGVLLDQFYRRHVLEKNRATTAKETKRLIDRELKPVWGERDVRSVTKADVIALVDAMRDRGAEITANRLLALLRTFFNWLASRDILTVSPAAGVKAPTAERSRDRVLNQAEIAALWAGCEHVGWPFGPFVQLLLLTGQRRSEVAGMRWSELDFSGNDPAWVLPKSRTKNGNAHSVPLSGASIDIIRTLPRVGGPECDLVFTTNGRTSVSGYSKGKRQIDVATAKVLERTLPDWRLHDLRRTAATLMAQLGHPVHVIEAVLNHQAGKVSGVAAIYNRYDYAAEKRAALDALSNTVLAWSNK